MGPRVDVLTGDGAGHFALSASFFVGQEPILAADLDGDGRTDLVGSADVNGQDGGLWVLRNTNCLARRLASSAIGACPAAGAPFSPQPSVRVLDDGGNTIRCDGGAVTASIVPGTERPAPCSRGRRPLR